MDIRNIKEMPPVVEDGKYLEMIYELQKKLMAGYIGKIEKNLPNYPISINSEKGQLVLKDFSARVIEETCEGYESTTEALKLAQAYGWNIQALPDDKFDMLLNHLQNSNEEQADAFAFFVELMLYANIQPEDIYSYVLDKYLDNRRFSSITQVNLSTLFGIGLYLHEKDGYLIDQMNLWPLLTEDHLKAFDKDVEHVLSYIPGFKTSNEELHRNEDHMLWKVAYHLNIGRNFLKNKTWKQTQELTDTVRYQEQVVLAFINYCGYLSAMGFKPETFYVLFYKKHAVNLFRQASHY